eukprot:IDg1258t1
MHLAAFVIGEALLHRTSRYTQTHLGRYRTLKCEVRLSSSSKEDVNQQGCTDAITNTDKRLRTLATAVGIGMAGSVVGSLIGAGGGVVLTPLMTTVLGVSQHSAHGTSLCTISVTAALSALRYARASQVDVAAALSLTCGAALMSPLGARRSAQVRSTMLRRYFGVFLLVVSVLIPILPKLLSIAQAPPLGVSLRNAILVAIGLLSGFLSGLLGIGGGTINVPALVIFAGFTQKVAQGSALLAMLLPSVLASISHRKLGQVRMELLPGLVFGAIIGSSLGAELAIFLPEQALRFVCAFIFFLIGVRYLWTGAGKRPK